MVYGKCLGWDCVVERGDKIRRKTWEELKRKHPKSYRQAMENFRGVKGKKDLLFFFNLADGDLVLCSFVEDLSIGRKYFLNN